MDIYDDEIRIQLACFRCGDKVRLCFVEGELSVKPCGTCIPEIYSAGKHGSRLVEEFLG